MPFLIFIFTFLIYLNTTAPGILVPDSPEFIASSFSFGIAHPSGYPFYLLLGKVFSFIPIGNLAWRMNLMSALFASLVVICIYILSNRVIKVTLPENKTEIINKSFAFIGALVLAFSHSFWPYAVNTEAYSTSSFLLSVAILLLILCVSTEEKIRAGTAFRSQSEKKVKRLYLLSLFAGLLLAFHSVNLIYVVLFVGFVVVKTTYIDSKKEIKIENLLLALSFFLLGLSILFYLPIRSVTSPFINIGDSSKWGDFFKTITGKIYIGELSLFSIPFREKAYNLLYSVKSIGHQFTLPLTGIGLIGIYLLLKKKIMVFLILLSVALANILFFANYDLGASRGESFPSQLLLPFYIIFSVFLSVGLAGITKWTISRGNLSTVIKFSSLSLVIILLLRFPFYENYKMSDSSLDRYFYEFGKRRIETFEPNSVFLCTNSKNSLFFLWYFNVIENRRLDIDSMLINPFVKTSLEKTLKDPKFEDVLKELKGRVFNNTIEVRSMIMDSLLKNYLSRFPFYINSPEGYIREQYVRIPTGNIYRIQDPPPEVIVNNPAIEKMVNAVYNDKIVLIGYNMDRSSAHIGETIKLSLFWKSLEAMDKDYKFIVLITGEDGRIIGKKLSDPFTHKPAYGIYPTSKWRNGEVIKENMDILIHLGFSPGIFYINLAVGGEERGEELLLITSEDTATEGRFVRTAKVEVLPDH
ncbi:MAG: DUF2723 domain-containing protein [Desulfobacterales bacterium]|nr:DUF2723 domain-containing protein [Desulfobacterales bacterium]